MSLDEIVVIVAGVAAIAWVNWYFLVVGRGGTGSRDRPDEPGSAREPAP